MLRVDLEPARDVAFHACMTSLSLPGLQLIEGSSSPARISRTGRIPCGRQRRLPCSPSTGTGGIASVWSGGREQILRDEEAILMMGNEPTSFCRTSPGHSFTLRVPRAMLRSIVADADDAAMRLIPSQPRRARAAVALRRLAAPGRPIAGARAAESFRAAYSGCFGADTRRCERFRGNGADARLAGGPIEDREGLYSRKEPSARYFGRERCRAPLRDAALSAASVRRERHHLLGIPGRAASCAGSPAAFRIRFQHAAISTIAYDVGFGDLSYFNRRFRRLYGLTPREVRGEQVLTSLCHAQTTASLCPTRCSFETRRGSVRAPFSPAPSAGISILIPGEPL